MQKHKKKYLIPNIKSHIIDMRYFMISASKQSYKFELWEDFDSEPLDLISIGKSDYGFSTWENSESNGVTSGRKSYELEEW